MSSNKRTIIALSLITAICLAGDSMLYIVLPTHWKEAGLSSIVQVGILLSINRFVRLPLNPLIGYIYKKVNFRNAILLAVVLSGITTIAYGLVQDFKIWLILRSVWGLAWSLFKLGAFLLILQLSSDTNRGNLMGTYNSLYRLGSLVGMLLGGLFADVFGLKMISLIFGGTALVSIYFVFAAVPKSIDLTDKKDELKSSFRSNMNSLFEKRLLKVLLTAFLLGMFLEGMLTATLSHIIEVKFSNTIDLIGISLGAATLAGVLQSLRWAVSPIIMPQIGKMLDRTKDKRIYAAILLAAACLLSITVPFPIHLGLWLPLLFTHLMVASILTTVMDIHVTDHASRVQNKVFIMTAFTILTDLGAALGPISGYSLEQAIGLANLFWLAAFVCFLLALTWIGEIAGSRKAVPHSYQPYK